MRDKIKVLLYACFFTFLSLFFTSCTQPVDFNKSSLSEIGKECEASNSCKNPTEPDKEPTPPGVIRIEEEKTISAFRSVDILFVIDNSGSMEEEQKEIGRRFSTLISLLKDFDYRIAITTTDVSSLGQAGRLIRLERPNLYFIDPSVLEAQRIFESNVKRPEVGSSDERGIFAAHMVMRRNELNWIRPESHLAVVVLSDENERSDGTLLEYEDLPSSYIKEIKKIHGESKGFSFHAIIVRPGDFQCLQKNRPDGLYGTVYADLVSQTNGILGDICSENYSQQLSEIGTRLQTVTESLALQCEPQDNKIEVIDLDRKVKLSVIIQGRRIIFVDKPLPGTRLVLRYSCMRENQSVSSRLSTLRSQFL